MHGAGRTLSVSLLYHTQDSQDTPSEANQLCTPLRFDHPVDDRRITPTRRPQDNTNLIIAERCELNSRRVMRKKFDHTDKDKNDYD